MQAPPLLIVGYGYLGRRLVRRCLAESRPVAVLTRSSAHAAELARWGVPHQILDLDKGAGALALETAGRAVIYTAPPGGDSGDTRLAGLLSALGSAPARVVYISTSGVYGDCAGRRVDEESPLKPGSDRARRRVAAEQAVEDWAQRSGGNWTVLRVPGIYGPHRLALASLAAGEPYLALDEASPGNRIHVDDLVSCCLAAADYRGPNGPFNVGDGNPLSATAFAQALARAAGLPPPPLVSRDKAPAVIGPGRWSFLSESRQLDIRRMREALGVTPRYEDPVRGLEASLREMAADGPDADQG